MFFILGFICGILQSILIAILISLYFPTFKRTVRRITPKQKGEILVPKVNKPQIIDSDKQEIIDNLFGL